MCWRLPKVCKAKISVKERNTFKSLDDGVIQGAVSGMLGPDPLDELFEIYSNKETRQHAIAWLTEQADLRERRAVLLKRIEVAVLIIVTLQFFKIDGPTLLHYLLNAFGLRH